MSGGWEWVGLVQTRALGDVRKKAILMHLANSAGEDGQSHWGTERIAAATDIGVRTVRRILADFEADGIVTRDRKRSPVTGQLGVWHHHLVWDAIAALPWNGVRLRGIDGDPFNQVSEPSAQAAPGAPQVHLAKAPQGAPGQVPAGCTSKPQRVNPREEPQSLAQRADSQLTLVAETAPAARRPARSGGGRLLVGFDAFWRVYPRREGKGAARNAWDKAIRKANAQDILIAAERYRDDPNREPQYTAHAATWLNQERWDDDPLPPRAGQSGVARTAGSARRVIAAVGNMPAAAVAASRAGALTGQAARVAAALEAGR